MTVTFSDIKAMLEARPAHATPCSSACGLHFHELAEAGIPLADDWQYIIQRIAQFQNKPWPVIAHPRVAIYASNYGDDVTETKKRLGQLAQQQDPLTRLCSMTNADLRVYELDLSQEITSAGITEEEASHAMSYGLMAVEEHVDCLIVDCLSSGSRQVLHKWHEAMLIDTFSDPLILLQKCGAGHDLFAMMGAIFAARMANIPVFSGTTSHAIFSLALTKILPNESDILIALRSTIPAPDVFEALNGFMQLRFTLALGPQPAQKKNFVTPRAA